MEQKLTALLLQCAEEAEQIGIRSPRYVQSLQKLGGVSVCKAFLKRGVVSDTFDELIQAGRPDLTAEAVLVKQEFSFLFTDDEINACFAVLCDAGYFG